MLKSTTFNHQPSTINFEPSTMNHQPSTIISQLPPQLFWDVDIATLDWNKHAALIVQRVIERGTYKNLQLLEQYFGKQELANIIKKIAYLHPKDIAFVHTHFSIPYNELKCYTENVESSKCNVEG